MKKNLTGFAQKYFIFRFLSIPSMDSHQHTRIPAQANISLSNMYSNSFDVDEAAEASSMDEDFEDDSFGEDYYEKILQYRTEKEACSERNKSSASRHFFEKLEEGT
jgi:hypothetical protein